MGLGLLLVPALAGYLFLERFNGTRYSLPRKAGYHVVFQSAIAGVILFFLARMIVLLLNTIFPVIGRLWKTVLDLDYSGTESPSPPARSLPPACLIPTCMCRFLVASRLAS